MSKTIDFSKNVHDLYKENPEIIDIMREIGFEGIANVAMLNTAGRFMTIPKGARMRGIDMGTVREAFIERGYEIKE